MELVQYTQTDVIARREITFCFRFTNQYQVYKYVDSEIRVVGGFDTSLFKRILENV